MVGQVGPIDRQSPLNPRTPAPSTENEDEESRQSKDTVKSGRPGNTTEEEGLAELAESIHINSPHMVTMTETEERIIIEEPIYARQEHTEDINPYTGHRHERVANIVDDEAALQCTTGPDRADPPSGGLELLPELPPIRLPQDDRPGRGLPGGGFPGGGGFPRGGGGYPGGGGGPLGAAPPGGGWGPPPTPLPQGNNDKLVGETPTVFDGDQKQTQMFINQWELYWGVNNNNTIMMNPYRQAMFFLTYVKGA